MHQQLIMAAWREWLIESGLSEDQAKALMAKGYSWVLFLESTVTAAKHS